MKHMFPSNSHEQNKKAWKGKMVNEKQRFFKVMSELVDDASVLSGLFSCQHPGVMGFVRWANLYTLDATRGILQLHSEVLRGVGRLHLAFLCFITLMAGI